jgi:RNA 2',3'-cyclic 3'-phosphodiesterase
VTIHARLFFAAFPDRSLRQRIESKALELEALEQAHPVRPENYHMTLAFIGEVSNQRAAAVRAAGSAVRAAAFEVRFDAIEHWPKAEVLVASASDAPAALLRLHRTLREVRGRLGLPDDPRPFRPHITLVRKVAQAPVLKAMSEFSWSVRSFRLVRSSRSAEGSVYTVVDTWSLLDTE